jgi:hypothetical protein
MERGEAKEIHIAVVIAARGNSTPGKHLPDTCHLWVIL